MDRPRIACLTAAAAVVVGAALVASAPAHAAPGDTASATADSRSATPRPTRTAPHKTRMSAATGAGVGHNGSAVIASRRGQVPLGNVRRVPSAPAGGGTAEHGLWAAAAAARREIGRADSAVATTVAMPATQRVVAQAISFPILSSSLDTVKTVIDGVITWIRTYVDPPWLGSVARLWNSIVDNPPVATAIQIEVDLAQGVSSHAIPFAAVSPSGRAISYSVPDRDMPGSPARGTVTVDNVAGTFTYTPDENFIGTDSFAFIASDAPTAHIRVLDDLIGSVMQFLGLSARHRDTATVSIFNGVPIQPDPEWALYTAITGSFSTLTYGVAGMLNAIPNALEIGSRLNDFDIVNVQGDVAFQRLLAVNASFPDQTPPRSPIFSDGLSAFSAYAINEVKRVSWSECSIICLGAKGFAYSQIEIPGGESIDLYNVETNSGIPPSNADIAQLSSFIQQNSIGRAVIVQGGFNQLYSEAGETLTDFAAANGLTDAWVQLEYGGIAPVDAPTCSYASSCEQDDKVFYRSAAPLNVDDPASSPVQLFANAYSNEGLNFRNGNGQDLSNSTPQAVTFGYSVAAVGPLNVDPENWMAKLPGISELPLTQLPIPGTHDSGTYGITPHSEWALTGQADFGKLTQLPPIVENLIVKPIAAAWGRTQGQSLSQQFADGIRYVDLRFSNEPDGTIYIEHGLRGPSAEDVVGQIAEFAYAHPKEILFVQVSRLTNFDADSNEVLVSMMVDAFGSRMVPRSAGTSATLEDLWAIDKSVVVIYDDDAVVAGDPNLWDSGTVYQPWWNVQTMDAVYLQDQAGLAGRPPGAIWGLSGGPTPDPSNIAAGILLLGPVSNYGFITRSQPTLKEWLSVDFKTAVNLVTADWVQQVGPTSSSYSRDVMAAVYETLGRRLVKAQTAAPSQTELGRVAEPRTSSTSPVAGDTVAAWDLRKCRRTRLVAAARIVESGSSSRD